MDELYIQQVLQGDINSYRYLVEKYKNMAFTIARGITGADLVAEEVVQDGFLKAFQNLKKFKRKAKFSTWFYKIVVNESLKRARKKKPKFLDLDDEQIPDEQIKMEPEAIEHLHEEEQKEMINNILNKLNDHESLLLRLYHLEEMKNEEISKITDLSVPNVKVILYRARKNFAARLNKSVSLIH
ncbi:ECF RNA polymerase sigma factor SigW [subsurface metagenome]